MKAFAQLLILVTAFSSSSTAAAAPAPAASGFIISYTASDCVQVGGAVNGVHTALPLNSCQSLARFFSFQGLIQNLCPEGKVATVTAFSGQQCSGTAVIANNLPSSVPAGPCEEKGGLLGFQSARFTCEAA